MGHMSSVALVLHIHYKRIVGAFQHMVFGGIVAMATQKGDCFISKIYNSRVCKPLGIKPLGGWGDISGKSINLKSKMSFTELWGGDC